MVFFASYAFILNHLNHVFHAQNITGTSGIHKLKVLPVHCKIQLKNAIEPVRMFLPQNFKMKLQPGSLHLYFGIGQNFAFCLTKR